MGSADDQLRNLVKSAADVVSIDGWSQQIEGGRSVHIDLTFREAPVGGSPQDTVRFRLALLRAELVAINPKTEGLEILPSTVARERVEQSAEWSNSQQGRNSASLSSDARVGAKGTASGSIAASGELYRSNSFEKQTVTRSGAIQVQSRKDQDGNYRWELIPGVSDHLLGSGWDALDAPRFIIKEPQPSRLNRSMIFQVRCLREDLRITDIRVMPPEGKREPFFALTSKAKEAAAEAYLKGRFHELGLISGDLSNPFAEIHLLETVVDV